VAPLPANFGHVGAVTAHGLTPFAADLRHVLAIFADRRSALPADACHVRAIAAHGFATLATDACHVHPVSADGLPPFASRFSSLLRRKLVSPAFDMGGLSPLACDLSLPLLRHRGETAPRTFRHDAS
jgi:hypothetical protein